MALHHRALRHHVGALLLWILVVHRLCDRLPTVGNHQQSELYAVAHPDPSEYLVVDSPHPDLWLDVPALDHHG